MARRKLIGALLLGCIATSGAVVHAQSLDAFKVTRPGTVLIDRAARLAELEQIGPAAQKLCSVSEPKVAAHIAPVPELEGRSGYGGNDRRATPFDWAVIVHGADAFAGSPAGLEKFMALATTWARAKALEILEDDVAGSNTAVVFGLKRTLAALIPNWALVRTDPQVTADDRKLVDDWVGRLVDLADVNTGGMNRAQRIVDCPANQDTSNCNNHRYLRDAVNVMWGALAGDDKRFRKGIERVRVALQQMRPDGSLPLETRRGARALWYQNYALGMLTTIAEVAARQGYDLYAMDVNGRTLHMGVAFLIAGIADPRIVHGYAEANVAPGPGGHDWREQDLRFTEERGRWHHMAWTEAYSARFPDHPNTARLRRLLPGLAEDRPLATRTTGGNASCFFLRR
jgi:poly(beta-D-mannuronate) lyase